MTTIETTTTPAPDAPALGPVNGRQVHPGSSFARLYQRTLDTRAAIEQWEATAPEAAALRELAALDAELAAIESAPARVRAAAAVDSRRQQLELDAERGRAAAATLDAAWRAACAELGTATEALNGLQKRRQRLQDERAGVVARYEELIARFDASLAAADADEALIIGAGADLPQPPALEYRDSPWGVVARTLGSR